MAVLALSVLLIVFVVAMASLVAWVLQERDLSTMSDRATIVSLPLSTILVLGPIAIAYVWRLTQRSGSVPPQASRETAGLVASAALDRWETEAWLRGISGPGQLPVAWHWAHSDVAVPAGSMNPPYDGPTCGLATELVAFYRSLDRNWKRLAIIGAAGSGKSATMALLLVHILRDRRLGEPVPVWITLGGWNPTTQRLRDYAAEVLGRDFPFTRARAAGGRSGPVALLDNQHVSLFLDGLDEMPPDLQAVALKEIVDERTLSVVMTSRSLEYASVANQVNLDGPVIEMAPLSVSQTITALNTGHKADRSLVWERFTCRMVKFPAAISLWTSPLVVSLLRQAYESTGDPCELLGRRTISGSESIQTIRTTLIERVLDQAYPDTEQRKQATHWLTWVASNLKGSRDIRWWDIPRWTPHLRPILALITILGGAILVILGPKNGITMAILTALIPGIVVGQDQPRRWAIRQPAIRDLKAAIIFGFFMGLVHGLVFGAMMGTRLGIAYGMGTALWGGLIYIVLVTLFSERSQVFVAETPARTYRFDRRFGLLSGLIFGSLFGVGFALSRWVLLEHGFDERTLFASWITLGFEIGDGLGEWITTGLAGGFVAGLMVGHMPRPSWLVRVAGVIAGARFRCQFRPMQVLETALSRQILRQVGSVYQFRHAEFQDHLVSPPSTASTDPASGPRRAR